MALRGDEPRLLGVAGIHLGDGDGEPHATAARLVRPDAFHARHAGGFDLPPDVRGAIGAAVIGIVVRRHRRYCAEQDRILPVHEGVDADHWLLLQSTGVVAGPLAERTFGDAVLRIDRAFECDLSVRRDRQPGLRPEDHLDRLAEQAARHVVFVLAVRHLDAGEREQQRMHAGDHRDRAALAALVVAAHQDVAVLALRAHHRGDAPVGIGLDAVGAVVDPARIRVLHDHHAAGADVRAAVELVPLRHRDLAKIDLGAGIHVLHDRPALHRRRRDRSCLGEIAPPVVDELDLGRFGRHAHRQRNALDAGEDVRCNAVTARIAGNLVEQHRLVVGRALVDIDDAADLLLAVRAAHLLQLARGLHLRQPVPQIRVRHIGLRLRVPRIKMEHI